jgi:hypothetical protein
MRTFLCILITIAIIIATGLSQTTVKETSVRTETNVERLTLYETTSGPGLIVVNRQESELEAPIRGITKVDHLRLKLADLGVEEEKMSQTITGAKISSFDHWDLANISKKELLLVGSDIDGISPLEDPNNMMVRLWLVPISLGSLPKASEKVSNFDMIADHLKTRNAARRGLSIIRGAMLTSVEELSVAAGNAETGICVGCTKGLVWVKEFSLNPLDWQGGGEILNGSFVKIAATASQNKYFIATIDNLGAVKVFSIESAKDLKNAPSDSIVLPATGNEEKKAVKEIVLTSSNKGAILGVLADTGDKDEVYIYRNLVSEKKWQLEKRIALTRKASSLSILVSGKDLVYCYLSKSGDGTDILNAKISLF